VEKFEIQEQLYSPQVEGHNVEVPHNVEELHNLVEEDNVGELNNMVGADNEEWYHS
jgi:hypothetical protein